MASVDETVLSSAAAVGTPTFLTNATYLSAGGAAPTLMFYQQQTALSTSAATSVVTPTQYATLNSTAAAVSTSTPTTHIVKTTLVAAGASSATIAYYNNTSLSAANSLSFMFHENVVAPLVSTAGATSTTTPSTTAVKTLVSAAAARSSIIKGLLETSLSAAASTSTVTPTRVATATSTSAANAVGSVVSASSAVVASILSSAAAAASSTPAMNVERFVYLLSRGAGSSSTLFRDPNQMAYVVNTETEALSMYDNFSFDSITYVDGKAYAACFDGFYVLEGGDDDGENIDAELVSGFMDFGNKNTKHVGSLYLGYTSDGPTTVSVETYGSGHDTQTNELDQRDAFAPRNNRVKLGKGLSSRYWRIALRNKNGSHFELNDAAIDVAVSKRRV